MHGKSFLLAARGRVNSLHFEPQSFAESYARLHAARVHGYINALESAFESKCRER